MLSVQWSNCRRHCTWQKDFEDLSWLWILSCCLMNILWFVERENSRLANSVNVHWHGQQWRMTKYFLVQNVPDGSLKNIVYCSPGMPLNRKCGSMINWTPAFRSLFASSWNWSTVSAKPVSTRVRKGSWYEWVGSIHCGATWCHVVTYAAPVLRRRQQDCSSLGIDSFHQPNVQRSDAHAVNSLAISH